MMKKRFGPALILTAALIAVLAFSACGGGGGPSPEQLADGKYVKEHLTGAYAITYEFTGYDTDGNTDDTYYQKVIRADEGYYYLYGTSEESSSQALYIKNGDKYDCYYYDSSAGTFKKAEYMGQFTQEEVEYGFGFGYMTYYSAYSEDMKKAGSETIAGRKCTKYKYNLNIPFLMNWTYKYSVDNETGVCMRYAWDIKSGGEKAGFQFVCTEFKTSGVSLPSYS